MKKILILARMTFREAIRRRIVLTGLVLGICFLVIFSIGFRMIYTTIGVTAAQSGSAAENVVRTEASNFLLMAGLYAVAFLSIAMGALLGADTLAGEISSGSIQTIITKPLRRADVVIGKWLGFAGLLGLYSLLMSGGTVLSVFFQSAYVPRNILTGLSLIYLEALFNHDRLFGWFQCHAGPGHRRDGFWIVWSGLSGRLDRTDRCFVQQYHRGEGRHYYKSDHSFRGALAACSF